MLVPALLLAQPPASSYAVADEPASGTAVSVGGPAALTAAAIDAVRRWTAEPVRRDGTPIIAPVTFQVKFGSQ